MDLISCVFVMLQESGATMGTCLSHVHRVPDRHTLRQNVYASSMLRYSR